MYKARASFAHTDDGKEYCNLPCTFTLKKKETTFDDGDLYLENATLIKTKGKYSKLKIDPRSKIVKSPKRLDLANLRFKQKEKVSCFLEAHIQNKKVLKLLLALSLGYLDHKTLSFEFSKLGLSHLLAISGFHFGMLSFFLFLMLQIIPSKKVQGALLIALLSLYVLYLGGSSSVTRAYVGILIYLVAKLFSLRPNGMNTLCLTFVLSYLFNPACIFEIGFQLSYIATFAILAFYKEVEISLHVLIPKREPKDVLFWPFLDKLCYILLCLIRKSLAISFVTSIATLPFLLHHFQRFPLISFFYNLFIPPLFVIVMALLFFSFCMSFSQALSHAFLKVTESFSTFLLQVIEDVPKVFELYLFKTKVSFFFSLFFFAALFMYSLYLKNKIDSQLLPC